MKGIILAGGQGNRLFPITKVTNKHLLPVFDKPMIFYSLISLMSIGIREVLIITNPCDKHLFEELLHDGSQWGMEILYRLQQKPRGIAECFLIAESFIEKSTCCVVLGDNFFHGKSYIPTVLQAKQHCERTGDAAIFGIQVSNPSSYGIVSFTEDGKVLEIKEKPSDPASNWAVPGLYFYGAEVVHHARVLAPSARGELEISDLNQKYIEMEKLKLFRFENDVMWKDLGTPQRLLQASNYVKQKLELEENSFLDPLNVALNNNWVDKKSQAKGGCLGSDSVYNDILAQLIRSENEVSVNA